MYYMLCNTSTDDGEEKEEEIALAQERIFKEVPAWRCPAHWTSTFTAITYILYGRLVSVMRSIFLFLC